ncbi:MAG: hypothetical protein QW658_00310 [Candidatus Bathyarchaeia archaeon]
MRRVVLIQFMALLIFGITVCGSEAATLVMRAHGNIGQNYAYATIAAELLGKAYDVYAGGKAPVVEYQTISMNANDIVTFRLTNAKFNGNVKLCVYDNQHNNQEGGDLISTVPSSTSPQGSVTFRINTTGSGKNKFALASKCASDTDETDYQAIPLLVDAGLSKDTKIEISVPEAYIAGTSITLSGALASATILTVDYEQSAELTRDDRTIDFGKDLKEFTDSPTDRALPSLKRTFAKKDISAGDIGGSDNVKVEVSGPMSGIKEIFWDLNNNDAKDTGEAFSIDTQTNTATIQVAGNNGGVQTGELRKVHIVVDKATPLTPRTYKLTYKVDFGDDQKMDRWLIVAQEASTWSLNAVQFYVPLVGTDPSTGRETYIKLQSKYKASAANDVFVQIVTSDGTVVEYKPGKITPGVPLTITGKELKDYVESQGKSVDGAKGFAVIVTVNAPEEHVFAYANIIDASGAKRVPVKTVEGKIVE